MEGSSLVRFKTALVSLLNTRLTAGSVQAAMAYQSPMLPEQVLGSGGYGVAAWFDPQAETAHEIMVLKGTPLWVDEVVVPRLRIQALGINTDYDQEDVDTSANNVLGYAIALCSHDPSFGLVDDSIQEFDATPVAWEYLGEPVGTNVRAAMFVLSIQVRARLKLTFS